MLHPRFLASLPGVCRWAVLLAFWPIGLVAAENERWLKVVASEFTVIMTLREKDALSRANEFAQFVAALRGFIDVDPRWLPPLTMVVFARERDFVRFQNAETCVGRPECESSLDEQARGGLPARRSYPRLCAA